MRLLFDIETDGLLRRDRDKPEATKVHSLVVKDVDTGEVTSVHGREIPIGVGLLEQADWVGGHNVITFDIPILEKFFRLKLKPTCKILDTLNASRLIWTDLKDRDFRLWRAKNLPADMIGSHSLEAWGNRLREQKDTFGKTTDWKEWSPAMQAYCEQDVEVTERLLKLIEKQNYSQQALNLEMDFQKIIYQQEQFGFAFDVTAAVDLQAKLAKRKAELTAELQETFPATTLTMKTPAYYLGLIVTKNHTEYQRFPTKGAAAKCGAREIEAGPMKVKTIPFNPGSRKQIADRLMERGWTPTKFTDSGDPQIDETVLDSIGTPEAKLLNEYLLVGKRLGQVAEGEEAWLKLERNGRIHGRIITNGAVTGRCTHLKPNVSQTPAVIVPYGVECRSCYTVDPGNLLVGCDAAGLELRMLAHYLARYDDGEYVKVVLDGDPHSRNREALGLEATKENRNFAKVFIYKLLYGAGDENLGDGNKAKGATLRAKFMSGIPAYARLVEDVRYAVRENGSLRGLDGRRLNVRSAHSALNTLLQSAGALSVKQATIILYNHLTAGGMTFGKEYALVAHVHDEMQIQVRSDLAEEVGKIAVQSIREAGVHFNLRIPLDGEFKVGRNWAETH